MVALFYVFFCLHFLIPAQRHRGHSLTSCNASLPAIPQRPLYPKLPRGSGTGRDALRTTHQKQHNFFHSSFISSIQCQYKILTKICYQNNIIEILVRFSTINSISSQNGSIFSEESKQALV